jgi:NitT/TauT family transport system substrate-binding protein
MDEYSPRRFWSRSALLLALIMLVVGATAFIAWRSSVTPAEAVGKVTLAVPTQINSAPVIVAFAQDLFRKAGVEVINQPFDLGKDALKSVLDGNADLAVVADTPFMFALHGGNDLAVLASISQARRSLAIVARKDRGIERIGDLTGKTIGLPKGTNAIYFLEARLQVDRVPYREENFVDLSLAKAASELKEGRLDAIATIQPFLATLLAEMGDKLAVFYGEDVYAFRFLLVGKPAYIDSHPQEVRRVLGALAAAEQSIIGNPALARRAVGDVVKVGDDIMAGAFDPEDYVLGLDQALLLSLDDQTRWAMKSGLVKPGPMPNYLNVIKRQPLEAVNPSAVKLVR